MTNKRTTKRALLSSVVALFLCFAMLIGTTYAWFTDSVTSANNIIKSGNLDITLEYWNGTGWVDVEGASDILTGDRWEPGYSDVAYLRIKNAGSLALKYQLGVNIVSETAGKNAAGELFLLSDYIYFGVDDVNGETDAYATREAALAAVTEPALISTGYTVASSLEAGSDYDYLAMIVYMPTDVDNDANHDGVNIPQIDLGINVMATQDTVEADGFNTNDYDAGAWDYWDGTSVNYDWYDPDAETLTLTSAADLAGFAAIVNGTAVPATTYSTEAATPVKDSFKGQTIVLEGDVDLMGRAWTPIGTSSNNGFYGTFDGQGHTIKNLKLAAGSADGRYGAGFFGNLLGGAVIKNVTFEAPVSDLRANIVGVAAGYLYGSATFENVHVVNANVMGFGKVGGILGMAADPGAHTVTMTNCSVEGVVGGCYNVGGLMGLALQGVKVALTDCTTDVKLVLKDASYNKTYATLEDGSIMWIYSDTAHYAAAAELYCYYDAAENEFCEGAAKNVDILMINEALLREAIQKGGEIVLDGDIAVANTITVPAGVTVTLDLNGYTISGTNTTTATHNDLFLVKGELTVSGGKVTLAHDATNMGWNGATSVFDVTAGGVLNIKDATVENLGGTDMNFAVHLNNWGEVTLNVVDSYLKATYMPVRVFNSGPDVNNVTIEGSTLDGGNHSFWVHNYAAADMGGKLYSGATAAYDEAKVLARLNFDIYGNGNTFKTGKSAPVRYGFNSSLYFTADGAQFVTSYAALQTAISKGGEVVLGGNITVEESINVPAGVKATLDLNGFNLTSEYVGADHFAMFTVPSGASLTVKGEGEVYAKTEFTESNRVGAIFQNAGEVVLEGGSYEINDNTTGKTWIISTIVDNRTSGASCQTVLTINGGDYTVSGNAKNLFRNYPQQGGTATIKFNGGQFNDRDGSVAYIWNQESGSYLGELYFNGGVYDSGVVYEDYNGQSDIHIAEGVVINAYSGNN